MKKLKIATASFFLCLASIGASENNYFTDHPSWVKECQDNRIYLNCDRLSISNDGIFVADDSNIKIPISMLFSDSTGIYTRPESVGTVYPIVWCHTCHAFRVIDAEGHCGKCGNYP